MLILQAYGEKIECDRVEKGANNIKVYLNGQSIREDDGISDFSGYSLTDESGNPMKFSTPESDDNKMDIAIRAVVTALAGSGSVAPQAVEGVIYRALEIAAFVDKGHISEDEAKQIIGTAR